jgi:enolase
VQLPEEMRDRLLNEDEIREFRKGVRKEVEMNKDKVYVSVKGFYSKGASERDSLLVEMDREKSVSHLL